MMLKERKPTEHIDETEFVEALSVIRGFSPEKQMFALAFVNGMEFQKSISKDGQHAAACTNSIKQGKV